MGKAKDDLHQAMTFVQGKFAAAATLQNKRNNGNIKRTAALLANAEKNRVEAKKNLQKAVITQQRAMSTLASATNARIKSTNKHVSINAAQIKENAKKAREDLDKAVNMFDKKVANARSEAAKGRAGLSQQLADQDKSIRQWADNKLKVVIASTAAQFRRVRAKMAANREHADNALKSASTKMTAALNADAALNTKRFNKTVKDITAAKAEAKARVKAAKTSFKVGLRRLSVTIEDQVGKANARTDQLTNTVQKNKVAQAKVNGNVAAETTRMIKLGNKRYAQHLAKDKEMKSLIDANKAATDKRMKGMAAHYMMELNAVKSTMKKNRAHATHMLAKESSKLYAAISKNEAEQLKTNKDLAKQTRSARMDIADALTEAKGDFAKRLGALHTTVVANDKKAEKKLTTMSTKTKAALNVRVTAEISKLTTRANSQIEGLRLNSAEARGEMKKQLLYAIRSMAEEAKKNLDGAVKTMTTAFTNQNAEETKAAKKSAKDRAAIAAQIKVNAGIAAQEVKDATATMQRSLLALKFETETKITKTNKKIDAYANAITKEAKDVAALMKVQMTTLTGKIDTQKAAAKKAISAADAKSAAGFIAVANKVKSTLKKAADASDKKFTKLYTKMANQRKAIDNDLATSVTNINDSIAKQAALADSRFSKTVKSITAARAEATKQVKEAREDFATDLNALTAKIKKMDTKLTGEVMVVSGEVISHKAAQNKVNRHVNSEINRIEKKMNDQHTVSTRARGKLRKILDENKRAAAEEVKSLSKLFKGKIASIRSEAAGDALAAKKDLTKATFKMYGSMADAQKENLYRNKESARKIGSYSKTSLAGIAATKKEFDNQLTPLGNTIAANHKKVEKGFEVLTGVVRDYKSAGKKDRKLIRKQNKTLNDNMEKAIATAVQIGEARAKRVADEARENLSGAKKALLAEITNTVEDAADKTFKTIQGKHGKIADNYLSLKAYACTAEDKLTEYVGKGKGRNLSSLGDLLVNVAGMSSVKPGKAEGLSPSSSVRTPFSGEKVPVKNSVNKINALVNELMGIEGGVRLRWPMGLGKYLLSKVMESMTQKGVLQVDKIDDKSGNWVFLNGHAVGLSNKLNDFESLAVRMSHYESTLAKLTAKLAAKKVKPVKYMEYAKAPEWQGN